MTPLQVTETMICDGLLVSLNGGSLQESVVRLASQRLLRKPCAGQALRVEEGRLEGHLLAECLLQMPGLPRPGAREFWQPVVQRVGWWGARAFKGGARFLELH